jgi:hypothetical protein
MKNSTIRCFIHKDINNNFIISSKRKIDNYTPVTLNYIKENFLMFDGKKYENMLSHDYRKYLINGGNIKLRHLKEDKIFLKFYNDTNIHGLKPLNEIVPDKISLTPTKLSTASETHDNKQLTSLNRNKESKNCLRNNNVKPLNEKSHPIDRIINKYY